MKKLAGLGVVLAVVLVGFAACDGEVPGGGTEVVGEGSAALGAAAEDGRYILTLADYHTRGALVSALGGQIALELPGRNAVAAYLPPQAAQGLAHHPGVVSIEIDPRRYPMAETVPYGVLMVQANEQVFSNATGAIKVCVIDSGLHTGHADFQGISVSGKANTSWNQDGCGHGTHVAGTIAAARNDFGVVGVAPRSAALHIVRVFGNNCNWSYSSNLVAALDECREAGAKVVSMSLGGSFSSSAEANAFQQAYDAGVLSVAAAGNGGSSQMSYPASYDSVISVAAIDSNKVVASFSQRNSQVELAAPGVGVLSTVPWRTPTVTVGGQTWMGGHIEGSARTQATGGLVDGGLCTTTSPAYSGKIVLCERGSVSFAAKVQNVQNSGGVAALIYNNVSGFFSGTLGQGNSSSIPAVSLSREDGQTLVAEHLGQSATVNNVAQSPGSGHEAWNGTSMATPHVSGVAALVWSFNPAWTNVQIRDALTATAQDLGTTGRDNSYGHGLVQAAAALAYLQGGGGGDDGGDPPCKASGASCTAHSECCSGTCRGKKGQKTCR